MNGNGDDNIERYCSDVIKDMDEFVVYSFSHEDDADYERMVFDDPEVAANYKRGSNSLTEMQRKIVKDLTNPASFLDKMITMENEGNQLPAKKTNGEIAVPTADVIPEMMFGMTEEEFDAKFKKVKKRLKDKRKEFEKKAKDALIDAAKLYLGEKHSKNYNKYKLELNQSGLSSIMYQLYTMRDTLESLTARIKASGSQMSGRDVEVFVGLQRVMLDVSKFQYEYMDTVEKSMKELKADLEIAEHGSPQTQSDEGTLLFFRGSKEFIKQLGEFRNSMDQFVPTPSKNKLLNADAVVVDIQAEEAHTEEAIAVGKQKNPFSGYEGAAKKPKRHREDGEDGDGMEDYDI